MNCKYCGNEIPEDGVFCVNCGKSVQEESETAVVSPCENNPVSEKLLDFFKDKLFLTICILIIVSAVFSCANGTFSVLSVLFTIFLWIIYSQARKGIVDSEKMRCVSGTVYAGYIITWVAIGLLGLCTVVIGAATGFLANSQALTDTIERAISESDANLFGSLEISLDIASLSILTIMIALIVIFSVAIIISVFFNIFGLRAIHKFAKSLYLSAQNGSFALEKLTNAKNWILTFGIIYGVTAISNMLDFKAFIAMGSLSALYIISYILIGKHFKNV